MQLRGSVAPVGATLFSLVILAIAVSFSALAPQSAEAAIITIQGTANPFLADPTNIPDAGNDLLDGIAPTVFDLAKLPGENKLNIVSFGAYDTYSGPDPSPPNHAGSNLDGTLSLVSAAALGGISGWNDLPRGSLVGIFLGPTVGLAPAPNTQATTDLQISPLLGQVFFIGDGLTGTGTGATQEFFVPDGATKLLLAVLDAPHWQDNTGSARTVVMSAIPEPSSMTLLAAGLVAAALVRRQRPGRR